MRVAKQLQYGCTWINTHFMLVNEMPHGGVKTSRLRQGPVACTRWRTTPWRGT